MSNEPPFKNLIVGIDGMRGGRDALALARLLGAPGATVTLAHVRAAAGIDIEPDEEDDDAMALLEREREQAGIQARLRPLRADSPGRGLHELADREGSDLLVVGSSHRGVFGRVLLGDSTREAINGSPCAVAVAPLGYADHPQAIYNVGVGYQDTAEGHAALDFARALTGRQEGRVIALQALQIAGSAYAGYGGIAWGDALTTMLTEAQREMDALEGVEGRAVLGLAGESLSELGNEVDLLIAGSRGYGPVRSLILGSTSQYLARHSRCPLLVLLRSAEADSSLH